MFRKTFYIGTAMVCALSVLTVCNNPVTPQGGGGETPAAPAGAKVIYADGFGGDLSKWETNYMINMGDFYPHMQITTAAAHTGTHSITSDSSRTALLYALADSISVRTGIAGVQFYLMAKALDSANFTVEIGKNAGSSGGLGYAFGIGIDPNNSLKCKYFDMLGNPSVKDSMIGAVQLNHWYKCVVEVNFSTKMITYAIDNTTITMAMPATADMSKVDRLLVYRGQTVLRADGYTNDPCKDGPKQYYADDIVFYQK